MNRLVSGLTLLLAIAFVAAIATGCAKKSVVFVHKEALPIPDKAKILTAYKWREASILVHQLTNGDTVKNNITGQFASIDQDDLTIFNEDGTFIFEEGATKFKPLSTQKYQKGTWQLDKAAQVLSLTFNNSLDEYAILSLDSTQLVVRLSVEQDSTRYTYIITYTPEPKTDYASQSTNVVDGIYTNVDHQPQFPGGMERLFTILNKQHSYPKEARKNGIEGKVVIQFVILEDGRPSNFEVIESIGYGCDEAALKAFQSMPKWKPGMLHGQAVKVKMQSAYVYKLQ